MNLLEGVSIAIESLRGHKLRTFLTLLGNIVGTMSVIAVVSLIYGADRYAREAVLDEGTDVFTITRVDGVQFLPVEIDIQGELDQPGDIKVRP